MSRTIILGVIVIIILYLVISYLTDNTRADLIGLHNAKTAAGDMGVIINSNSLPGNNLSNDYTYSMWVFINDWSHKYGEEKVIFRRTNTSNANTDNDDDFNDVCPSVSLGAIKNEIVIKMATGNALSRPEEFIVEDIPIQKWVNVIITTEGRAVDVYIDGKLVKTYVLNKVIKINDQANIYLTPDGGYSGYLNKFRYYSRTMSPREAYEIYAEGSGTDGVLGILGSYKLNFAFGKSGEMTLPTNTMASVTL
mgnify:CR=1 FL=1|jgi:hypothetical protein